MEVNLSPTLILELPHGSNNSKTKSLAVTGVFLMNIHDFQITVQFYCLFLFEIVC